MLMGELAQEATSRYAPYFKTLPHSTDCLMNWSPKEQALLTGTSLGAERQQHIQDVFQRDILPLLQEQPDLFPPSCLTYEHFRRAADLVQTRAFHMKADNWVTGTSQESTDELYLIPAIDMLNHSTDSAQRNTSLALVRGETSITLANGEQKNFKDFFSMKAERDIPAGCEVLHTYGQVLCRVAFAGQQLQGAEPSLTTEQCPHPQVSDHQLLSPEAVAVDGLAPEDDDGEDDEDEDEEGSDQQASEEEAEAEPRSARRAGRKVNSQAAAGKDAARGAAARGKAKGDGSQQYMHKRQPGRQGQGQGQGKLLQPQKDSRPHYGDMTGPEESDLWQSDDSDKVGYSSESSAEDGSAGDGNIAELAAAAAAAAPSSSRAPGARKRQRQPRQRHTADPSEPHTYEVGASGHVREVHGHMLGPDEEDLIQSDDSDKVGYVDDQQDKEVEESGATAEAGDVGGGSRRSQRGGSSRKAASGGVDGAASLSSAAQVRSKKPKKGLGFKG
eukprot:gene4805-5052_t